VYAAESFYWHAFSLYRVGTERNLRKAIELLETQRRLHPRSRTASDALTLATRMRGDLALAGSDNALRELGQALRNADECSGTGVNVKIAALNAFQQIDAAMTVNYLRDVFQRRNPCARYLREQSVFILAQIDTPEADELMLGLARDAGDLNVRIEAVQFLAEVPDVRAVALLESIVRGSAPTRLRESALFALSRQSTMADASLFRDIAESPYTPPQLRVQAVQWLAEQQFLDESSLFLRLYKVERNEDVRHALVNAVANQKNVSDAPWLLQVGRDSSTALATRKLAISAAAALQAPPSELYKLYREVELVPLRQQIIDILGRHREQVAVSMLIDIVSVEAVTTLRGTSLGWLRQSKDPRAVAFISSYREK
jgi:HEAT repeat protein